MLEGSLADAVGMGALVLNYGDGTITLGDLIKCMDGKEVACVEDLVLALRPRQSWCGLRWRFEGSAIQD